MNLEPCPFCGGKAEEIGDLEFREYRIRCSLCHVGTICFRKIDDAIDAWNTRPDHDAALAAAVQAEREACLAVVRDRADRHKAAAMAIPNIADPIRYDHECRQYELNAMADVLSLRPSPAPAVGEWRLERSGLWRFVVGERCLASVSTNINRWYTFSPEGGAGESGYVADLDSAKRAAVDALVRQGWYRETTPAVDVLAVAREYVEAHDIVTDNVIHARVRNHEHNALVARCKAALQALRALVAPRTSGVQATVIDSARLNQLEAIEKASAALLKAEEFARRVHKSKKPTASNGMPMITDRYRARVLAADAALEEARAAWRGAVLGDAPTKGEETTR